MSLRRSVIFLDSSYRPGLYPPQSLTGSTHRLLTCVLIDRRLVSWASSQFRGQSGPQGGSGSNRTNASSSILSSQDISRTCEVTESKCHSLSRWKTSNSGSRACPRFENAQPVPFTTALVTAHVLPVPGCFPDGQLLQDTSPEALRTSLRFSSKLTSSTLRSVVTCSSHARLRARSA